MQNKDPEKAFLTNEKKNNKKKENEKVANRKLGNLGNFKNIFPSFRFCPTAKIENSDLKISENFFRVFRDFRVFQVLCLALNRHVFDQETPRIA